jgi:hypothetical protein
LATEAASAAAPRGQGEALPELAKVYWRARATDLSLARTGRLWTATTLAHTLPFLATAVFLILLNPITIPVGLAAMAQAWIIPELYAARGANVLRPRANRRSPRRGSRPGPDPQAERVAVGFLGDLIGHSARDLHARTGLVIEHARLGAWVLGEAGALLVRPGGKRVHCLCVRATDGELPPSDRIAHLLLALRTDEEGFITVANQAFAGARWRLRRRLDPSGREALEAAVAGAREMKQLGRKD